MRRAFTFLELLLVILLIGILVATSVPNLRKNFDTVKLNSFSGQLQAFMNYLHERSIVEQQVIYLNFDREKRQFKANMKDSPVFLKILTVPEDISIETQDQVLFYPDGQIDGVTISIIGKNDQKINLTTKGVFGGTKILP